jgi:hypothetical protein
MPVFFEPGAHAPGRVSPLGCTPHLIYTSLLLRSPKVRELNPDSDPLIQASKLPTSQLPDVLESIGAFPVFSSKLVLI